MLKPTLKQTIESYIRAYNNFDVERMVAVIHPEIVFENIANEEVTLSIKGIKAFKQQAEEATKYFVIASRK